MAFSLFTCRYCVLPLLMAATISISHKGKSYNVQAHLTSTIYSFQAQLQELTSVPVENQKLLFKGKRASSKGRDTLEAFGLRDGTKVQVLGSTMEEIGDLRAVEDEKKQAERILRDRETQAMVRQTLSASITLRLFDSNIRIDVFSFKPIQSFSLKSKLPFPRHPATRTPPKPRLSSIAAHETVQR